MEGAELCPVLQAGKVLETREPLASTHAFSTAQRQAQPDSRLISRGHAAKYNFPRC